MYVFNTYIYILTNTSCIQHIIIWLIINYNNNSLSCHNNSETVTNNNCNNIQKKNTHTNNKQVINKPHQHHKATTTIKNIIIITTTIIQNTIWVYNKNTYTFTPTNKAREKGEIILHTCMYIIVNIRKISLYSLNIKYYKHIIELRTVMFFIMGKSFSLFLLFSHLLSNKNTL